jgi:hypothetical protein
MHDEQSGSNTSDKQFLRTRLHRRHMSENPALQQIETKEQEMTSEE